MIGQGIHPEDRSRFRRISTRVHACSEFGVVGYLSGLAVRPVVSAEILERAVRDVLMLRRAS
eukprot:7251290-Alexandrium_andersonii.AAC.1